MLVRHKAETAAKVATALGMRGYCWVRFPGFRPPTERYAMGIHYSVRVGLGLRVRESDVGMDRLEDIMSPSTLPEGFESYIGGDQVDDKDIAVLIARPEHVVNLQETLDPIGNVFGVVRPMELVKYDEYVSQALELLLEFAYDNDVSPEVGYFIVSEIG